MSSLGVWTTVGTALGVSVGSRSSQLWCVRNWGSAEASLLVPFLKLWQSGTLMVFGAWIHLQVHPVNVDELLVGQE